MSRTVFVENHGEVTYRERFQGVDLEIPAGGAIKMQRREAIAFLSTMSIPDPLNHNKPKEKKLVMVTDEKNKAPDAEEFISHFDGRKFRSKSELNKHLLTIKGKVVEKDSNGNIIKKAG